MNNEEVIDNKSEQISNETPKKKPAGNKPVKGVVIGCEVLNVREKPDKVSGTPITTIPKGATVTIDESKSTDDFYKVTTKDDVAGFCMKSFIKVY